MRFPTLRRVATLTHQTVIGKSAKSADAKLQKMAVNSTTKTNVMDNYSEKKWKRALAPVMMTGALLLQLATPGIASAASSLLDLYNLAVNYDAEIAAAQADFDAASANISLARSNVRPQASIGYRASYNDVNSDQNSNYIDHGPTLSLRQTIFNATHLATIDQAKATVKQAEAQLEAQKQNLMLRVAQAYFDVLRAKADQLFSRSELEAIGRQKEQNERRFEVGLVAITDVKDAQAQFDLATAQEIAAANRLAAANEALLLITGANETQLAELRDDAPLLRPSPEDINQWIDLALEQNLQLVAAEMSLRAADAELDQGRANRYPTLDLVGLATSNDTSHNSRQDIDSGELRLELNMPLLTGGRTSAQIRQASAKRRSAEHQLELQRRLTIQDTKNSYRNVIADISRVGALKQALISTQKSLEAQEAGFAEGLLTSLEVLRSLRDTFRAQSDYSAARYEYIINTLNLKRAAGLLQPSDLEQVNSWLTATGS